LIGLPPYDAAAAQQLIDSYVSDHGGSPIKFVITTYQQSLDQARVEFIQAALNQFHNVEVESQVGDVPTNSGKVISGDYMVSSWGFPTLDPDPGLYGAVYSSSFTNFSKYKNPEVDKLLDEAHVSKDDALRKQRYDAVYEILARDVPFYPYAATTNGFVTSSKLRGGAITLDGILRYDLLWRPS
jgi:peptide/nickel transport system substrate-binding protein